MTKTTVVIPNYNGIQYVDECLHSLCQGTRMPEIILVDNGSGDGSRELVREKYKEVQVIEFAQNTGFSSAVNAGIRAAVTEYVILLNNDTVVDREFVENLEKALSEEPGAFSAAKGGTRTRSPSLTRSNAFDLPPLTRTWPLRIHL